ncbi:cytochrome C oxidase Cbb3 [Jiulongibacter sediminis]|jgi:hypothetical protein|uniref:cytochrome C oxidase Cbb3 n=1 Tax=Jiulongibacter sediminis TaxID=1605367 RepID=UPI0009E79B41|nr:cytochrome C oxidase Cbb3 [Jiulongibacter sediminis]
MFKNYLSGIEGVSVYPVISLTIFVVFFILLGFFVFKADKRYINHMENLPLEEGEKL